MPPHLPPTLYARRNVHAVARRLLGCVLATRVDGKLTSGIITEVEAYAGVGDRASHSFGGRRSRRNEVMYGPPGRAYLYLCYGLHTLINVVTSAEGDPQAVLIRSVEPLKGLNIMMKRRGLAALEPRLTAGPGSLARALGATIELNGENLSGRKIWIEEGPRLPASKIARGPRVGVAYAGEHARLPWRYWIHKNRFVSALKTTGRI